MSQYVDRTLDETVNNAVEAAARTHIDNPTYYDEPISNEYGWYWSQIMMRAPNPFQELLALFWHDHFATSCDVLGFNFASYWYEHHIDILRNMGMGDFKDMVHEISIDWSMLEWLNGVDNRADGGAVPQENFARELFELFLLGEGNGYTETDIQQAARCFSGFRRRYNTGGPLAQGSVGGGDFSPAQHAKYFPALGDRPFCVYTPSRHDTGNKTLFGQTITGRSGSDGFNEYMDVIDVTFDNRDVAEFICTKLFKFLVHDNPSQATIDALAAQFRADNYQLKPLLKTMLMSQEMYSAEGRKGIVKSPIEYLVGFIRSTGLECTVQNFRTRTENCGQILCAPYSVAGWPAGDAWFSADSAMQRANAIQACISSSRAYQSGTLMYDLASILPAPPTAENVVDEMCKLLNIRPTTGQRDEYIAYLNVTGNGTPSTFDGTDAAHINERVRGLLYILSQHPDAHVK